MQKNCRTHYQARLATSASSFSMSVSLGSLERMRAVCVEKYAYCVVCKALQALLVGRNISHATRLVKSRQVCFSSQRRAAILQISGLVEHRSSPPNAQSAYEFMVKTRDSFARKFNPDVNIRAWLYCCRRTDVDGIMRMIFGRS